MGAVKKAMLKALWKEQKEEDEELMIEHSIQDQLEEREEERLIEESIQDQLETKETTNARH
jgi:hypothetical protein|tara:strand:+ start:253 stop:435 length:183 start_codon:yes stop_codon:yes gene_type:complete